jgi:hypothetical protein
MGQRRAPRANPRPRLVVLSIPAAVALAVWWLSLAHLNPYGLGPYGLPPALPITWYLALLAAVTGAVTAIVKRRSSSLLMVVYVLVVAIILFGTAPMLSAQPHYAWVYKHIGVVRFLASHGQVDPSVDIYNRWPGFFALAAMFTSDAGRSNPETYAGWAELFFLLLDTVLIIAAVNAIARDIRIGAGAALLFVGTNWVGQTYYSPQAFAEVLALALTVIILRHLRTGEATYSPRLARLMERIGRVKQLPLPVDGTVKWPRWAAITTVLSIDAIIVASHQLTPYVLLISIGLLMLVGVVRPWWLLIAMGAMTLAYLAANFHFIQHNYGIFSSIDPFNNIYVEHHTQTPVPGKTFNTDAQLLLIALFWGGALAAGIRLLRRGLLLRALPLAALAIAPFAVILGQNYGGEASLRVILFSDPWCAALISWALATVSRRRLRWALTLTTALVLIALFVPSFLGQEELNFITPDEVQASEWFYYNARHKSVLVLAAPGFPYRYGGTYPDFAGPEGDANPNLLTTPAFQGTQLGAAQVPVVIARIREYSQHGYIAFTKDETTFAEVFGVTPPGALGHLQSAVATSPDFRLAYANRDAQIYEFTPPASASSVAAPRRVPGGTALIAEAGALKADGLYRRVRRGAP